MANHKQALKRHRQSEQRRERNRSCQRKMKTALKKAEELASSGAPDDIAAAVRLASSAIAKTSARGVIPGKRAARKISRTTKALRKQ